MKGRAWVEVEVEVEYTIDPPDRSVGETGDHYEFQSIKLEGVELSASRDLVDQITNTLEQEC